jgi:hypothetical protein
MNDCRRITLPPSYRGPRPADSMRPRQRVRGVAQVEDSGVEAKTGRGSVTHGPPSPKSIPSAEAATLLSASYARDLDALVAEPGVALWVHGHVHPSVSYCPGSTGVVSNPSGYPDSPGSDFVPEPVLTA